MDIQKTLQDHKKWLADEPGGICADLSRADLRGADLHDVDLRGAILSRADLYGAKLSSADLRGAYLHGALLSRADLYGANMNGANLYGADLSRADLRRANLSGANLYGANMSGAYLSGAELIGADLRRAILRGANLYGANMSDANMSDAELSGAELSGAELSGADLSRADLSGAKGLLNPARWLADNFEIDDLGYIIYKAIAHTPYKPPEHWRIEPGAYLEEVPNPLPTVECGCGVNFGTLDWVRNTHPGSAIWRCRIRWADLPLVVVPYNTDGKARCGRLELLEKVA